ncbi:DNA-directed RNA polymerase V subunit 1 [Pyrus ussuriensis x Pyrus communis]|uniref:DNA-directed RNA polymerase subunit n=1 Tax=Pyrus ussuriensis x Pyrus communis TaxID=2448454 RepID=A0A5N5HVM2_9ROSA|nr:DNA-directed RNA polymerase V subunit 1 [Pyrus ussuriensis x Pyrus communis]
MEEVSTSNILDGEIVGIKFGLATHQEICTASISDCSISHASQLSNPFLGLPLEFGKCESCGTSEPGKCEGHFGYIELPVPIFHPNHVSELKRMLSLLCLKCLKMKKNKFPTKNAGLAERMLASCCEDAAQVCIGETKPTDSSCSLQLKRPSKSRTPPGFWNFLERYGFRYGDDHIRTLLPCEVMEMLKRIPQDARKKLNARGYFPQDGYILRHIPVPPNCLSVPEISDGVSVIKVLKQIEVIRSSRSGIPNFESQIVEANELQAIVDQYLQVRGTGKASRDIDARFGVNKELNASSTKAWLEKMRTLFIRKGSGFSSRSVITGDAFRRVNEVGIPYEIAQRITFEERVNDHNIRYLQQLVDSKLCLTYRDGSSTYSLREGSKGHTFLRPGQVVHRRIMDGDLVFVNRPPTTHKHSLQALQVYVHDDHVVKINPLICGPLSADFDGDCIHLFYPQSLAAKAEVLELFSVEKQLLSSHSGKPNLQMATDSLLSLRMMFKNYFLDKSAAQQLAMFASSLLPRPALLKANSACSYWTALQILQTALPPDFDYCGEKYLVNKSEILKIEFSTSAVSAVMNDIATSVFFEKGGEDVLKFFDSLQPLLMENIFSEGFSVGLEDFYMSKTSIQDIKENIQGTSDLLYHLRSTYNEFVEFQLESRIKSLKVPVSNFILESSAFGDLIDTKSDSAINKVVQQIGFLGLQLSDKGRFYSKTLVEDVASLCHNKYSFNTEYPSAEYGLVQSCFFHGLDPYEEIVHSIATREVIVRSSRGLTEPGTLFKNLMAILRDVVICYDGTVRNVCSNSVIQFEYGVNAGSRPPNLFPAGEPVGVLAATAMSNPAYKAVLDSTPSSNSSWELMKEILLCKVNFKNELIDRRVILYLNNCGCGRKYCRERAACLVKNQLKKVSLKDTAVEFMIEYSNQLSSLGSMVNDAGLVGHIHLNEELLRELNVGVDEIRQKCQETVNSFRRKRVGKKKFNIGYLFKNTVLFASEHCSFHHSCADKGSDSPCLMFFLQATEELETTSQYYADLICPVLLETIIKGDPRITSANIIWIDPDTTTWIRSPNNSQKGEWALDVVLEKSVVKQSGDAWRIVLDSCLPVLHLIDTRRSIPYAIKQIQELLGVSCAFDQAVQRLSTAVTMVAKGVLKEHLILLANSMTCAGNFVGFNSSGYKALSRALNIQVPFTEATLFTPRRCFERAAEKCHMDSLSSIVASCSWGKHVAVGTGSRFDILWDTREGGLNQEGGLDVFNFLHMVSTANGEEATTGALGAEVDDLMVVDELADSCLSPELDSGLDKPVFEDIIEFEDKSEALPGKSSWEKDSSVWGTNTTREDATSSWEKTPSWDKNDTSSWDKTPAKEPATSTWGIGKAAEVTTPAWRANTAIEAATSAWGATKASENDWSGRVAEKVAPIDLQPTIKAVDERDNGWGAVSPRETVTGNDNAWSSGQQKKSSEISISSWGQKNPPETETQPWGAVSSGETETGNDNAWSSGQQKKSSEISTSSWGQKNPPETETQPWGAVSSGETETGNDNAWSSGQQKKSGPNNSWSSGQQKKSSEISTSSWGQKNPPKIETQPWGAVSSGETETGNDNAWSSGQQKKSSEISTSSWGQKNPPKTDTQPWGAVSSGETETGNDNAWSSGQQKKSSEISISSWGQKNPPKTETQPWGAVSSGETETGNDNAWSSGQQKKSSEISTSSWGQKNPLETETQPWGAVSSGETETGNDNAWSSGQQKKSSEISTGSWGQKNPPETETQSASLSGWDSPSGDGNTGERHHQWGQNKKSRFEGSKSWVSSPGEWKNKNRPAKPPGMVNDNSSVVGLYTATRQRLDMFPSEEQDVLSKIEPVMRSIRRIMHQSGYNDGDPLSADDQSFILDNVLNYHPDKAVKMGSGIGHLTVDRHGSFQDSRCFFVVTTDGHKEDFSYRNAWRITLRKSMLMLPKHS